MHGFFLMGDTISIYKKQDSRFSYLWVGVFGSGCGVFVSVVFERTANYKRKCHMTNYFRVFFSSSKLSLTLGTRILRLRHCKSSS
jgi:hypothetical protein